MSVPTPTSVNVGSTVDYGVVIGPMDCTETLASVYLPQSTAEVEVSSPVITQYMPTEDKKAYRVTVKGKTAGKGKMSFKCGTLEAVTSSLQVN